MSTLGQLIRTFVELRDEKARITKALGDDMDHIRAQIEAQMGDIKSMTIEGAGRVTRSYRRSARVIDPEVFFSWAERECPAMIQRKLDTTEALEYLAREETLPPGVGVDTAVVLSITGERGNG
jgi:hypothetical protein